MSAVLLGVLSISSNFEQKFSAHWSKVTSDGKGWVRDSLKKFKRKCLNYKMVTKLKIVKSHTPKSQNIITFPAFYNELIWITWREHNQVGMIFNWCLEVWGIILEFISACDGKDCCSKQIWQRADCNGPTARNKYYQNCTTRGLLAICCC